MDSIERRKMILKGDVYKVILTLALPIMINNLIQTLYDLADGMYVSELSSTHFASTSFVWPVNFLFISIGIGLSIAGTSILSQLVGASKFDECKKYASQLVAISFITSIVFCAVGFLVTPFIVKAMGATGELAQYSITYLKISFLGMPFMFLFSNFNSIMTAQGNTIAPTVLSAISAIVNVVLDPIFIFNLDMGIAGAAWATLIAKAFLVVCGFWMLVKSSKNMIKISFVNFKFDKQVINRIVRIAIPSSVGQSGSALGFMVLNSFIASYGNATMAAFGMVNRITSLIMQPAGGVGAALTSIVGQNLGYGQPERVKESFEKAMKLTIGFSVIGCMILILKDSAVINIFMRSKDDMEVINQGITYLKYISVSMPLMGIFNIFQGIFQGSGHTKYSMNMEIGRLWFVRLPMILLFKYLTNIGPVGIWFSMSFSNLVVCIYGYIVYKKGMWKKPVVKI